MKASQCPSCSAPVSVTGQVQRVRCTYCGIQIDLSAQQVVVVTSATRACPNPVCGRMIGSMDLRCPYCGVDITAEHHRQDSLRQEKERAALEEQRSRHTAIAETEQEILDRLRHIRNKPFPRRKDQNELGLSVSNGLVIVALLITVVIFGPVIYFIAMQPAEAIAPQCLVVPFIAVFFMTMVERFLNRARIRRAVDEQISYHEEDLRNVQARLDSVTDSLSRFEAP